MMKPGASPMITSFDAEYPTTPESLTEEAENLRRDLTAFYSQNAPHKMVNVHKIVREFVKRGGGGKVRAPQREFFIDNLLVRIHCIIVLIWWTGIAPWEFEFPFPGGLTSTFLRQEMASLNVDQAKVYGQDLLTFTPFSSVLLSSLELRDTTVYEP